ncbi:MAG: S1/P1 nuclease [Bacteroidota bacterium]|nr:S1/P1 nuclease [Bacteroidota bacterium]
MKLRKKILFIVLLVSFSFPAMAWWGMTGHRVVGEIAESYLSSKARKAIKDILGDESLAMASNWADFIKSDSAFNYLSPWHYTDMKGGLSHDEVIKTLETDTGANLYAKFNFIIRELKNKQLAKDKKVLYLRLLIHFVGDLHQPLHVGGRTEDQGGNRVRVLWFNDSTNLHNVWDEKLVENQKLSYTEFAKAINHVSKEQRLAWQKEPVKEWFFESYQIAQGIYSGITRPNQRLSYRYNFDHIATVNEQLLKGGVRLAGLLNEIFG